MANVELVGAIIALIKVIKMYVPRINGAATVLLAVVLGGAAGYFHVLAGLDLVSGIASGLLAVGVHVVATQAGGAAKATA